MGGEHLRLTHSSNITARLKLAGVTEDDSIDWLCGENVAAVTIQHTRTDPNSSMQQRQFFLAFQYKIDYRIADTRSRGNTKGLVQELHVMRYRWCALMVARRPGACDFSLSGVLRSLSRYSQLHF